ncbi:hydrogenase expression/formation protein HypC [Litorivivens lipolytica]|uniref:Hydrogenase expression/formation protein HypC n=1 Tax=Litorivivens lipolytica TaxID=1524264 RepID=A0A7W4Z6E7_9GAMM|nr:HypC/HybG/HupF family hydrogenase formation chaperone [Litorivivens lipolytica]MBB3046865.1 hydrogenase expression/formation protein HypC [Litorivivens lipolytica]
MCLGIPAQVKTISNEAAKLGIVEIAGVRREINLACVCKDAQSPTELVGCWVLVHVGFAMALIDEAEAELTLTLLNELGELQAETQGARL